MLAMEEIDGMEVEQDKLASLVFNMSIKDGLVQTGKMQTLLLCSKMLNIRPRKLLSSKYSLDNHFLLILNSFF